MTVIEQKKALRDEMRETLKRMSDENRLEQSAAACANVVGLSAFQNAKTVLLYRALPAECDPAAIARAAALSGKRVAYPVCEADNNLSLYVPEDDSAYIRSGYGILEPDKARSQKVSADELDLIVVPGLAFDRAGHRLGRGAGYYDRLLNRTRAFKLGFGFREQLAQNVPTEPFDMKMDCVVLDRWIYCE
ncbi:MAG: 5-formyltetrahydrofolate cyclo-ligase [Clostridiaceae bacterium]|nr:5-formyltetrahydrofolate cyclo-ligase [Eubacteriales bacterium]